MEVGALPSVGPYAADSYRIFCREEHIRSELRIEWQKVVLQDKELQAWLRWRWLQQGCLYDVREGRNWLAPAEAVARGKEATLSFDDIDRFVSEARRSGGRASTETAAAG